MPRPATYTATTGGTSYASLVARPKDSDGTIIPGIPEADLTITTQAFPNADRIYYSPFVSPRPFSFDQFLLNVTTAVAGTVAVALFSADDDFQPIALLVDGGTIDAGTTGLKTQTVTSGTLPAGRYLLAVLPSSTVTLRAWRGNQRFFGLSTALDTQYVSYFRASRTASLGWPATPLPWQRFTSNTQGTFFAVMRFTYS